MKILWIFFGGSSQNWTSLRGHFFSSFLRSSYRVVILFFGGGGAKISNIFCMPRIPDIFGLNSDAGSKPTYEEKK